MDIRYFDGTSAEVADQLMELRRAGHQINVVYLNDHGDGTRSMCVEVKS